MEDHRTTDKVILEKIDFMNQGLNRIEEQVKYTNGKVRKIDLTLAYLKGALAVIVAMVLPMMVWFLNHYLIQR